MNGELLLYWMSCTGKGNWAAFRRAIGNLLHDEARHSSNTDSKVNPNETDVDKISRGLRYRLVELGHITFDLSRRWSVEPAQLLGFEHQPNRWYVVGARTPQRLERLKIICGEVGCTLRAEEWQDGSWLGLPLRWWVEGHPKAVKHAANDAGLKMRPEGFACFRRHSVGVLQMWEEAPAAEPLYNWKVRSFDLHQKRWVEETEGQAVLEYSHGYERQWHVAHRGIVRSLPKREAVYAAAALAQIRLAEYDPQKHVVRVPQDAALPEKCARLLCLTAGCPSRAANGFIFYDNVPPLAAALVFENVGQMFPMIF